MNYKEHRHLGIYGIIVNNDEILLIDKVGGPYDGKLDLPGGSMEFGETPEKTLKREIMEETGLLVKSYELIGVITVVPDWNRDGELYKVHHTAVFYIIKEYENDIKNVVEIDEKNNDSMGARFYKINELQEFNLSHILKYALELINNK